MAKPNFRKRSLAAKKGWETRRENLRRLQTGELNRREVGRWYQVQIDRAVEREVKKAVKAERVKHQRELADALKDAKRAQRAKQKPSKSKRQLKLEAENRKLRAQMRRLQKQLKEEEEIAESPRRYIEKTIEKLWKKYGRDGGHIQIKKTIEKMAKKFKWPQDDLWHWYFSPTWT